MRRLDTDGHRLAGILADDDDVPDRGALERLAQFEKVRRIARCESDGDRSRRRPGLAHALTGGVNYLRDLQPVGEVGADDDVVDQRGPSVNA